MATLVAGAIIAQHASAQTATAGQLLISEFRLRGPASPDDEFIEIYNNSGADHTVLAASGAGYGVAASDGVNRCVIPDGTVIPNRGHYLCTNSAGYSLSGNATGDGTYTTDIPDNAGIALFNNSTGRGSYVLANRIDAVGSTSEANTLCKEGTGYSSLTPFPINYSFLRDECGGRRGQSARPLHHLHAEGHRQQRGRLLLRRHQWHVGGRRPAPRCAGAAEPGVADSAQRLVHGGIAGHDFTSDPANNSTFGTLDIRRRFTNATGANVTRLRYRIIDLDTFPASSGFADLRPRTSTAVVVTVDRAPCGTGAPLDLRYLLGIQQTGNFRIYVNVEALP